MIWLIFACSNPQPPVCDTAADVTYAEFGESFLRQHCQGCHASTSTNRQGAPSTIYFDTVEDVWRLSADILRVTTSEIPTMPPAWTLEEHDIEMLRWWLECGSLKSDEQSLQLFDP